MKINFELMKLPSSLQRQVTSFLQVWWPSLRVSYQWQKLSKRIYPVFGGSPALECLFPPRTPSPCCLRKLPKQRTRLLSESWLSYSRKICKLLIEVSDCSGLTEKKWPEWKLLSDSISSIDYLTTANSRVVMKAIKNYFVKVNSKGFLTYLSCLFQKCL